MHLWLALSKYCILVYPQTLSILQYVNIYMSLICRLHCQCYVEPSRITYDCVKGHCVSKTYLPTYMQSRLVPH